MTISPYLSESVLDTAVGLLLINTGDVQNATTVSCFSEGAHHPTTLWISLAKTSYSHDLLLKTGHFSLAVLNHTQGTLALACGTVSGRQTNKCANLDLYLKDENFLFLRGALSSTSCHIRQAVEIDDHTVFVADILAADIDSRTAHLRHLLLSDLKEHV